MTSVPARPNLREAQKDNTVSKIKECGKALFYAKPFDDISVDEISTKAAISRATFYLHFSSKMELLESILHDDLAANIDAYSSLTHIEEITPKTVLTWLVGLRNSFDQRRRSIPLFPLVCSREPSLADIMIDHRERVINRLGERFKAFQLSGRTPRARARRHVEIHLMLCQVEDVLHVYSDQPTSPRLSVGFELVAMRLCAFLKEGGDR